MPTRSNEGARVVLVINALKTGGAERVFSEDASALSARGHRVTIVLLYGSRSDDLAAGISSAVRVVELQATGVVDLGAIRRLRAFLREEAPVAVVSTLNDANFLARTAVLGLRGVRYIRREANELTMKPWWHRLLDMMFDWRLDAAIALSRHMRTQMMLTDPWLRGRVVVLPNAVDIPATCAVSGTGPTRILATGSLSIQKDHATLIRACASLHQHGVDFRLDIYGEGNERGALEDMIEAHKLQGIVTLMGKVRRDVVLTALQGASIFVLPSRVEGSPNALLEAMAAGLPAVVSDIPSTRETASDASALFAPPGNEDGFAVAIGRLCADPGLRASMGAEGRGIIMTRFSSEKRIVELEKILYEKID